MIHRASTLCSAAESVAPESRVQEREYPVTCAPVILVAGGTGGHVYPALAMGEYLQQRGHPVVLVTDERGARYVPEPGNPPLSACVTLPSLSIPQLPRIRKMMSATLKAWKPCGLWGFGGGMTVPPLLMARWRGIPTAVHQADTVLGRANALLAPLVQHRFCALPLIKQPMAWPWTPSWTPVGMPLRHPLVALAPHAHITPPLRILIVGGSQGAGFWSTLWPQALALLPPSSRQQVMVRHQCPEKDQPALRQAYENLGWPSSHWCIEAFFSPMQDHLAWAHVVFARSGASTLAELALASRPGCLVPYPHATGQHQLHNATSHLQHHPGWLHHQSDLSPSVLAKQLQDWIDDPAKLCHDKTHYQTAINPLSACEYMYQSFFGP